MKTKNLHLFTFKKHSEANEMSLENYHNADGWHGMEDKLGILLFVNWKIAWINIEF